MPGERQGKFGGGNLIRGAGLSGVPAAIPDDDDSSTERPLAAAPEPTSVPEAKPDRPALSVSIEAAQPRSRRKPPVNVRLRVSTSITFHEAWLREKAMDLDLSLTDLASDLIEEALAARQRRRGRR